MSEVGPQEIKAGCLPVTGGMAQARIAGAFNIPTGGLTLAVPGKLRIGCRVHHLSISGGTWQWQMCGTVPRCWLRSRYWSPFGRHTTLVRTAELVRFSCCLMAKRRRTRRWVADAKPALRLDCGSALPDAAHQGHDAEPARQRQIGRSHHCPCRSQPAPVAPGAAKRRTTQMDAQAAGARTCHAYLFPLRQRSNDAMETIEYRTHVPWNKPTYVSKYIAQSDGSPSSLKQYVSYRKFCY